MIEASSVLLSSGIRNLLKNVRERQVVYELFFFDLLCDVVFFHNGYERFYYWRAYVAIPVTANMCNFTT
jgi:hypothetical protein